MNLSDADRFWSFVEKTESCWLWTGALDRYGYGQFWAGRKNWRAHRYAKYLECGEDLPVKYDHDCENRRCVRDDHLILATQRQNVLRSKTNPIAVNARKTHCKYGHEFTPGNTAYDYRPGHEGRLCVKCTGAKPAWVSLGGMSRRDGSTAWVGVQPSPYSHDLPTA